MISVIRATSGNLNYVDHLNNFVGFADEQYCCEDFSARILDAQGTEYKPEGLPYHFMPEKPDFCLQDDADYFGLEHNTVSFGLVHDNDLTERKLILALTNHHNGYYAHMWESCIAQQKDEGGI